MQILKELNLNAVNRETLGTSISIYSLLVANNSFLIGCGLWDRENMPHSNKVKNRTPGIVFDIDGQTGVIKKVTKKLANIVYPLVHGPWGSYFVGCRTGAAYLMDGDLGVRELGSFGRGVYGVAYSSSLDRFLIGGRDGRLYCLDRSWKLVALHQISDNRLWNLCLDHNDQFVWGSSYNGRLFKIHVLTGKIVCQEHLGAGATTLIAWLENGLLAVGCFGRCVKLLQGEHVVSSISVESPICFLLDLPERKQFLATGYKGQAWIFNYAGEQQDVFLLDSRENNPVWIGDRLAGGKIVLAWCNGTIRILKL